MIAPQQGVSWRLKLCKGFSCRATPFPVRQCVYFAIAVKMDELRSSQYSIHHRSGHPFITHNEINRQTVTRRK